MWIRHLLMSPQCIPLSYNNSLYLKCIHPSSFWRSQRVLSFNFFWNAAPGLPWCLTPHHQNSDPMCWTMKTYWNFSHTCCCSCFSLYHCCCFIFLVLVLFLLLFWSFLYDPTWALVLVIAHSFWISLFYMIILSWI